MRVMWYTDTSGARHLVVAGYPYTKSEEKGGPHLLTGIWLVRYVRCDGFGPIRKVYRSRLRAPGELPTAIRHWVFRRDLETGIRGDPHERAWKRMCRRVVA